MGDRRDYNEELEQTRRISPFEEMPEEEMEGIDEAYDDEYEQEAYADDAYETDASYDEAYDDAYDQEYDEEYDDEYEDEEEESAGPLAFLGTLPGKILLGVIVLLLVVVIALLGVKLLGGDDAQGQSQTLQLPATSEATDAPASIVFAPIEEDEPQETAEPTAIPTATPTAEPTATPLPIILTNTPTPSPTPTPTPTPSPTPTPTETPTPAPTEVPELSKGATNRQANLRETASSSGKVKETLKEGETVTIHEAILDKSGKVWYGLTVDDLATTGWMRDYVVDTEEKIAKPTHTPKPTGTPKAPGAEADEEEGEEAIEATPTPATVNENAIGGGRTKKEANVRKVMNGKVLVQLRKNKRVDILSVRMDKKGEIWYEVQPQGSSTVGFVRDYLIELDKGVELIMPTATPKAETEPEESEETAPDEEIQAEEKQEESVLDREVIGKAKTNREANVRVKPAASGKLIRQLSKGVELLILEKYQDDDKNIWYEVSTETGKTHGFVRDYLLTISEIDEAREAKTYETE